MDSLGQVGNLTGEGRLSTYQNQIVVVDNYFQLSFARELSMFDSRQEETSFLVEWC